MANPNPTPKPENLTPWQPGQSGNPRGRSLTDRLRDALEGADPAGSGKVVADVLIDALIRIAAQGDRQAIRDVFERVDGKVPEKQEHSGPGGAPLTPVVFYVPSNGRDDKAPGDPAAGGPAGIVAVEPG